MVLRRTVIALLYTIQTTIPVKNGLNTNRCGVRFWVVHSYVLAVG